MTYSEWIAANIDGGYGKCAEATEAMAAAFPELRRIRGHYHDAFWGARAHWWLVAPDGTIVDPTHAQFPDARGDYEPWTEGETEPSGLCMTCGGYVYGDSYTCSPACAAANDAYYGATIR